MICADHIDYVTQVNSLHAVQLTNVRMYLIIYASILYYKTAHDLCRGLKTTDPVWYVLTAHVVLYVYIMSVLNM